MLYHPALYAYKNEWERFRRTYEGGRRFVDTYLKKYNTREDADAFTERKTVTYCPAFASAAVDEINNAIFSRMPDVVRDSNSKTYMEALTGELFGVDYKGSSIDNFIGCELLQELTVMGRVGVYVDMPAKVPTVGRNLTIHPYYYVYRVEDIINWEVGEPGSGHEFVKLLLKDNYFEHDDTYGFPEKIEDRYRLLEVTDDGVRVTFLDQNREETDVQLLDLEKIPFVFLKIKHSLLKNVADYQIALLNIESTDVDFARKANFPIYTEQSNYVTSLPGNKPEGQSTGEATSDDHVRESGSQHGIRYAKNTDRPEFIHPSSEPMKAAMLKEEQMKKDIRLLVHLNVASLGSRQESRESKDFDREGLENGLSHISLILEEAERKLAKFWCEYENQEPKVKVSYPRNFDLRTDEDRRDEAGKQIELANKVPSDTFKKEMHKRVVMTLLGNKVTNEVLERMMKEVESSITTTTDPKIIHADVEAGLLTRLTASQIRGYPEDEGRKAVEEMEKRLKFIADAQGGEVGDARGVPDGQTEQPDSSDEKAGKKKRGEQALDA